MKKHTYYTKYVIRLWWNLCQKNLFIITYKQAYICVESSGSHLWRRSHSLPQEALNVRSVDLNQKNINEQYVDRNWWELLTAHKHLQNIQFTVDHWLFYRIYIITIKKRSYCYFAWERTGRGRSVPEPGNTSEDANTLVSKSADE